MMRFARGSRGLAVAWIVAACSPGPEAWCEAGSMEPWCPPTGESWFETNYEPVCGDAFTDCAAGVSVLVFERPSCDPDAPERRPRCAGGSAPYCYFADCRAEAKEDMP